MGQQLNSVVKDPVLSASLPCCPHDSGYELHFELQEPRGAGGGAVESKRVSLPKELFLSDKKICPSSFLDSLLSGDRAVSMATPASVKEKRLF